MHVPEEHKKDVVVKLACGSVAGLLGQTITYPLDVVRRQMQVSCSVVYLLNITSKKNGNVTNQNTIQVQALSTSNNEVGKGTFETLVMIIRTQGWKQLFSGLSINYLKVNSFSDHLSNEHHISFDQCYINSPVSASIRLIHLTHCANAAS